ncbi:unnamed protein product [Phytomonas sp. EM1]|nr:unnamed protein product [Phytomonas sp. EM1]|eukprot:CCW63762.1 unnamed protein product [Phytomonas sp. isolate EM1]
MYRSNILRIARSFAKSAPASTAATIGSPVAKPGSFVSTPGPAPTSTPAPTMGTGLRKKVIKKIIKKVKVVNKNQQAVPEALAASNRTNVQTATTASSPPPLPPLPQDARIAANPEPVETRRYTEKSSPISQRSGAPKPDEENHNADFELSSRTGEQLRHELRGIPSPDSEITNDTHAAEQPGSQKKTPMVKGYRIEEVLTLCGPSDAMFARRLPSGGCQFFAWPGTPLSVASNAIVSMPDTIRTVHAVFGRAGTPIDLVMDIDCPVPQEHWSMHKIVPYHKKILNDVLSVVTEEIEKIGETIESQVVLQSPNLKKASFHVHTKLKDVAFADYNSLYGFLSRFHARIPMVDTQIYRKSGMLRMFSCMKENHTSAMVVFDEPRWNIGFPGGRVPDRAAALHSVIVREAGTFSRVLTFEPPRSSEEMRHSVKSGDEAEEGAEVRPPRVLLPRTEQEAVETASRWLRQATEREVGEWRAWIGLGLCAFRIAYHFRDATTLRRPAMEEMLDAWREASQHCPMKFRHGDCEQRWASFDISKLGGDEGWWRAYQRLGRLEVPTQEALRMQEIERNAASATKKNSIRGGSPGRENKSPGGPKREPF